MKRNSFDPSNSIYQYLKDFFVSVEFEPLAKQQVAHHMLLFGCNAPFKKNEAW